MIRIMDVRIKIKRFAVYKDRKSGIEDFVILSKDSLQFVYIMHDSFSSFKPRNS